MAIAVKDVRYNLLNMHTRMPFKYGIATLTALPHLFVTIHLELDGQVQIGIASEGLPPKWFTKDPEADFADELNDMLNVIQSACDTALNAGNMDSVFDLWKHVYEKQNQYLENQKYPPLLRNFGVSVIERAIIDAFCRAHQCCFADAARTNLFGIRLGEIHPELDQHSPENYLPSKPLPSIIARHTVGLADPLRDSDIAPQEKIKDGLPQSLEACIKTYGLTHLKIKICADPDKDIPRLKQIAQIANEEIGDDFAFTLDGNEQYQHIDEFKTFWDTIHQDDSLQPFLSKLLFVEQPLHRDAALNPFVQKEMSDWPNKPPIIIDESDASLESTRIALQLGYNGTSHKNCKGVIKGIANKCLLEHRKQQEKQPLILSGEDLANVGPVALLQDLAVMATLGIQHVERNGHHYFTGLSMFDSELQKRMVETHSKLYKMHANHFATLDIKKGRMDLSSVNDAPFGLHFVLDTQQFTPLSHWHFAL